MNLLQPLSCWEQQGMIHTPGSEGAISPSQNGDNPNLTFDVAQTNDTDSRPKDNQSNSDPSPASPGDK